MLKYIDMRNINFQDLAIIVYCLKSSASTINSPLLKRISPIFGNLTAFARLSQITWYVYKQALIWIWSAPQNFSTFRKK